LLGFSDVNLAIGNFSPQALLAVFKTEDAFALSEIEFRKKLPVQLYLYCGE